MKEIFDPIRKLYEFSAACEELQDHIEFFSESVRENYSEFTGDHDFTVEMFPSWTPTMYINLGSPYQLTLGDKKYNIKTNDDVLILRDTMAIRHNLPGDHIFTIKFHPGGLEGILGISQLSLVDKIIDLKKLLPANLLEKIKSPVSFDERKQLLENFFIEKSRQKKPDHYLKFIADTIVQYDKNSMQLNINQLAEKQFTTSKTINRYFHRIIGTSPKNYFFLFRARMALTAYMASKKTFDPQVYGYYDWSHFYKDVVRFTGQKLADIPK
jgi:hypothetical protein